PPPASSKPVPWSFGVALHAATEAQPLHVLQDVAQPDPVIPTDGATPSGVGLLVQGLRHGPGFVANSPTSHVGSLGFGAQRWPSVVLLDTRWDEHPLAHLVASFSSASIPRFKIAISTARQHRSGLSPRLAAQRETASRSRCSSSTGTRIAVRHGESAGMTDTGALTLSPPCARVSTYVGLYLLIVGSSLSVEVGHEVRALQRRGPHFVLCDDCTTPAGCPAMGRWGRCKVAIHAWRSPVNTPTSTNPCRGGAGSHHADNFTDRGLSSTMKPSPFLPTRRRSTGF